MGHYIGRRTCLNTEKDIRKALADIDKIVRRESDNSGGLPGPISWKKDRVFDSEQEAEAWIQAHDCSYGQFAVLFRDYSDAKETAVISRLRESLGKITEKKQKFANATAVRNRNVAFVGCPNCKSRLAKEYLRGNRCPVCLTSLLSAADLAKLGELDQKIEEYKQRIEAEKRKQINKAKVMVLFKFEFHC